MRKPKTKSPARHVSPTLRKNIRQYLRDGGKLIVIAASSKEFNEAAREFGVHPSSGVFHYATKPSAVSLLARTLKDDNPMDEGGVLALVYDHKRGMTAMIRAAEEKCLPIVYAVLEETASE